MSTSRWRGTLLYVGSLAALGAAGLAKFGVLVPGAAEAGWSTGAAAAGTTGSSGTGQSSTAPDPSDLSTTGPSSTDPSTPGPSTTDSSTTSDVVTIVGSSVQTRYGPVQVSVTFSADRITDVQALQVPGGHRESEQINARATPILAREVVAAQSSQIDTVSGATYTSAAYAESVQSAIDQRG